MDRNRRRIRYAVVGLGNLTQRAVLPAFSTTRNSELVAFTTGNPEKTAKLAKQYRITQAFSYQDYDECLRSGIDAVFIGLPNHLHCEYAVRAAEAGIHVLCEKPMAVNEDECRRMIAAAKLARVKLMIAYRLHFEEGTLAAIELANSGKIGELRYFTSAFSQQVAAGNVRVEVSLDLGGGSMFDMGVYCINAVRYIFRDEPVEVIGTIAKGTDPRFRKTKEEMTSAILRFPGDRIATITSSFGAAGFAEYSVTGTDGWVRVSPAFDYEQPVVVESKIGKREPVTRKYPIVDQFGAEIQYFSDCILKNREPEPNGEEGLADIRIVRAMIESARSGKPVKLGRFVKRSRPGKKLLIRKKRIKEGRVFGAPSPAR
jgi:predicted dehydrogenase